MPFVSARLEDYDGNILIELPRVYEDEEICAQHLYKNYIELTGDNTPQENEIMSFVQLRKLIDQKYVLIIKEFTVIEKI